MSVGSVNAFIKELETIGLVEIERAVKDEPTCTPSTTQ